MGWATVNTRVVVGVMTGTSLDGIDVVVAEVSGRGLEIEANLTTHAGGDLGACADPLRQAAAQEPLPAAALAKTALDLGTLHVQRIEAAVRNGARLDLIAVHGQTVFHRPPCSWQMINPAPIAERLACPVVSDLRQADLAAGGRGAPITPLADWILFGRGAPRRAVVNLGGFCNCTVLPGGDDAMRLDRIEGWDLCACNQVLDAVARSALGCGYDTDGAAAAAGTPEPRAGTALAAILDGQRASGRSLGSGDEAGGWVADQLGRVAPNDLAATAVEAIATSIVEAINRAKVDQVILAGGGVANQTLRRRLADGLRADTLDIETLGIPAAAREALCIAVLGALCADGVPITLPQVTGCTSPAPVAGMWTGLQRIADLTR